MLLIQMYRQSIGTPSLACTSAGTLRVRQSKSTCGQKRSWCMDAAQVSPAKLAKRLMNAGPEAAGMALGQLCSYTVAEALPLMSPEEAAKILCMARPEAAVKVNPASACPNSPCAQAWPGKRWEMRRSAAAALLMQLMDVVEPITSLRWVCVARACLN